MLRNTNLYRTPSPTVIILPVRSSQHVVVSATINVCEKSTVPFVIFYYANSQKNNSL